MGVDMTAVTRLLPLLGNMNQDNEDTRLLSALRPYLHGQRAGRLEDTMKLLRLAKLIPLLQEQGISKAKAIKNAEMSEVYGYHIFAGSRIPERGKVLALAIGMGLSEELKFDARTGKPLNDNLLDYKLSTFMDHPHLEAHFVENPEPTSPYGTKSLGEPPTCSGAPAIRNAILNATGVAIDRCPITPHVLFEAFREAGLIEGG